MHQCVGELRDELDAAEEVCGGVESGVHGTCLLQHCAHIRLTLLTSLTLFFLSIM